MGNDPRTSVLNRFCQAHDVRNLFVADAAPFVGNPDKNPDAHDRRARRGAPPSTSPKK